MHSTSLMKTAVYKRYGKPEVIQFQQIPQPIPQANEMLIQVYASAVSATDCHFRRADPFVIRFFSGLFRPNTIPGSLISGKVVAVGAEVSRFKVGDEVFGETGERLSGSAEYICLPENAIFVEKPVNMSFEEAACAAEALTPWYFLNDLAKIQPGQKVMIIGASGALGTYGIQIAKYLGAEVTAVCSGANTELVRSLGADHVIDYQRESFTSAKDKFDMIYDAVGKSTFSACKKILQKGGTYYTTVLSFGIFFHQWTNRFRQKRARIGFAGLNLSIHNLAIVKKLIEEGHLSSVIDKTYPLEQIVDAHRYVDTGRKRGNVVLNIYPQKQAS